MSKEKFIIEPHFRLQEWVAEEKGYFKDEGLDYVFQELIKSTDGAHHYKGDKVEGQRSALCRRLFCGAVGRLRAQGFANQKA